LLPAVIRTASQVMPNSQNYASTIEVIIRQAEQDEANAMLSGDVKALDDLWSDEMLAYSTSNLYARKQVLLSLIANGALRLRDHRRTTLEVVVDGDRALAVGNESSQFEGGAADKIILCSYMNVWTRHAERWRLLGRHVGLMSLMNADPSP
jgi:ketosteroid isomerase-like protein